MMKKAGALAFPTPETVWRWCQGLLWSGLVLALLLCVYLLLQDPEALFFVPPVLIAGVVGLVLFRYQELNLYLVLATFVLITGYEEGIQVEEALYGMYFLSFLAFWFISRLFFYQQPLATAKEDWALLLFLVYVGLSPVWAILFGAKLSVIVGEALVLMMFAFYFPVKEVCSRHPKAALYIILVIAWLGVFAAFRNLLTYQAALSSATELWQIIKGRAALNEVLLMVPALGTLAFLAYTERWRDRLVLAGLFCFFFASLIVTQSRGYWAAFLLGALVLFVLTDRRRKGHILLLIGAGLGSLLLGGLILFPNILPVVVEAMASRFASLASSMTSDISLVNRFYESAAVWEYITVNPILGYGMGTPYRVFDLIDDYTMVKTFIHNGYLGLWFKYGIVGLGLMLFYWVRIAWLGVRLFRTEAAPFLMRIGGLSVTCCLVAEALVANTSTPFQISDAVLLMAVLGGFVSGSLAWVNRQALAQPSPTSS